MDRLPCPMGEGLGGESVRLWLVNRLPNQLPSRRLYPSAPDFAQPSLQP
ncbi:MULTISPECIES: hypothetical protein [unclassified Coleofasciculus]|nr:MULTISPECIES: hypothetical protein [unclassified Coleofasciculus]MBE9127066.1 hypothetical protein [Coleofasciculus sp. LEGE 07081]MBE9150454.1 hypothetical protein [Coleofasciculus sp. LEGE 07092]